MSDSTPPSEEFIRQFTLTQRSLYLFILMQVPNSHEAEEILQETNLVIWTKYEQFEPGTNFKAWARQIAQYEVLHWRQRRHRDKLRFSDEFLATLGTHLDGALENLDARRAALALCLEKLRPADRELIQARYQSDQPAQGMHIAEALGRPANSVYQSLGRIRRVLADCVHRQLALSGGM